MDGLTFDQDNHEYKLDGRVIPSVTQVLSKLNITDSSHYPENGEAAKRGSDIHKEIELYLDGMIMEENLEWPGYVQSAVEFLKDAGLSKIESECRFHDGNVAGTADLLAVKIGEDGSQGYVIDWKTGGKQDAHKLQVAMYAAITGVRSGVVVYLNGTDYKAIEVSYEDIEVAKGLLRLWKWISVNNVHAKYV